MRDYYRLSFPITSACRKSSQKLLLIGAILFDVANIFALVQVIYSSLYYLFLMAGLLIISTIMRLISLRLNYSYEYIMNGGVFRILRAYAMRSREVVKLSASGDFTLVELDNSVSVGTCCCNTSTILDRYMLTAFGKSYIVALDQYMYALLSGIGRADNDLS